MTAPLQAVYFKALEALDRLTYYAFSLDDERLEKLVAELGYVLGTAYAAKDLATIEDIELSMWVVGDELEKRLGIDPEP